MAKTYLRRLAATVFVLGCFTVGQQLHTLGATDVTPTATTVFQVHQ